MCVQNNRAACSNRREFRGQRIRSLSDGSTQDFDQGSPRKGKAKPQDQLQRQPLMFSCILTQNISGSLRWVWGSLFWVWMKWGNLAGSRMKKTGVLLNTQSQLPSSVLSLRAKPRGSRAVSAEPDSPPTVEKRAVTRTFLPTPWKRDIEVKSLRSWVTSKYPWAPAPLAWTYNVDSESCMLRSLWSKALTTRSGIRSRSKWARRSIWWKSGLDQTQKSMNSKWQGYAPWRRRGPWRPALWAA